ncbi:MAG: hypothetical protein HZC51_01050 [Nitrospirae bacterium]|nr:hypothetical protein [Nitrospirota bacterium]
MFNRKLILLLSLLFLLSTSAMEAHHHADGTDHPDCKVCLTLHHAKSETATRADVAAPLLSATGGRLLPLGCKSPRTSFNTARSIRPPPA